MGSQVSALLSRLFYTKRKCTVPLLGLDASGKSTIVNGLMMPDQGFLATIPTTGHSIEKKVVGNVEFIMYDVGGGAKTRDFWIHYLEDASAIIYVVDSADCDRLMEIGDLIKKNSDYPCFKDKPVLVLANKQDLADAMSAEDVEQRLGLVHIFGSHRPWKCMPVSGNTKAGIIEAFSWLSNTIDNPKIYPAAQKKYQTNLKVDNLGVSNIRDSPMILN